MEQSLERPPVPVQLGDLRRARVTDWYVGQDRDLRITVPGGLVEANNDTANFDRTAVFAEKRRALFEELARFTSTSTVKGSPRDDREVAVLPDGEEAPSVADAFQEGHRAEVPIAHPNLSRFDARQHLREQRPLLGMRVLARDHIGGEHQVGIQDHQSLSRQGSCPALPQHSEAPFGGSEVIAVDDSNPVTREKRRRLRLHCLNDSTKSRPRVANERARHLTLDAVEFVVHRRKRHGQRVLDRAIGCAYRWLNFADDQPHQVDD